jgi:ATP-dependent Lon protease
VLDDGVSRLISDSFPDVAVDKGAAAKIGAGERAIPAFVRDWLVCRYSTHGELARDRIQAFLSSHLPDKQQRELLKNRLYEGEQLTLLDGFEVTIDLNRGERILKIPSLDIFNACVSGQIVEHNPLLLSGPVWGAGKLEWRTEEEGNRVWMTEFQPMQTAVVDLDYFIGQRQRFTVSQWTALLLLSMGYEPSRYSPDQQFWLLSRLSLLVHPRVNLIELAPKGTGKSYVFSQLSKYGWLISGGVVTRAKLFYDMSLKAPGVITKYDGIILDEVQTIRFPDEGEIVGALKSYLEYGEFRVMGFSGNSEAGLALLANIPIGSDGKPVRLSDGSGTLFDALPRWLHGKDATALLDRFHGLIPGWEIPRIQKHHIATGVGLRADYFAEVLHALRQRGEYMDFVLEHTHADGSGDKRDITAIHRLCAAFMRLLFPDLKVSRDEFEHFCLRPARAMRGMIRDQMALMDAEYKREVAGVECTL